MYICVIQQQVWQMNKYADIDTLRLSARLENILRSGGVDTIGDLCRVSVIDLLKMPNFGKKSLKELDAAMKDHQINLSETSFHHTVKPRDVRPDKDGMKRVNYFIPPDMVDRLKEQKERTGVPVAEFVRRAIEAALSKVNL
jgi:predicted HicB family RNase H-like nuclease